MMMNDDNNETPRIVIKTIIYLFKMYVYKRKRPFSTRWRCLQVGIRGPIVAQTTRINYYNFPREPARPRLTSKSDQNGRPDRCHRRRRSVGQPVHIIIITYNIYIYLIDMYIIYSAPWSSSTYSWRRVWWFEILNEYLLQFFLLLFLLKVRLIFFLFDVLFLRIDVLCIIVHGRRQHNRR